ncbi:hypothetical protein, partial [Pseudomonas kilonensis]|uniref:hypothetical protein n=1 Tax=Pseudomonas kilonensis TaxID=132476 RepID=UPI001B80DD99
YLQLSASFQEQSLWEQSLLAIAVGQLASMLDVPLSSRASFAPTEEVWVAGKSESAADPVWELG